MIIVLCSPFVVRLLLGLVLFFAFCHLLIVARCLVVIVWFGLFGGCCSFGGGCRLVIVVRCLVRCGCGLLCVHWCSVFVVCRLLVDVRCQLFVV